MKTAEDLRKQFQEEIGVDPGNQIGFLAYVDWIEKRLTQQNTLNRDKVMEMLTKQDENGHYWEIVRWDRKRIGADNLLAPYDGTEELADAICSLALPELSDKHRIKMYLKKYPNIMMNGFSGADLRQAYFNGIDDTLAAIKELTNKK